MVMQPKNMKHGYQIMLNVIDWSYHISTITLFVVFIGIPIFITFLFIKFLRITNLMKHFNRITTNLINKYGV